MPRTFPPDVLVLDTDGLLHVRLARGRREPQISNAKAYRLAADTFTSSVVTPELANESAFAEALRRLRMETGRWEKVSVLLPDSWFRINIVDLPSLPEKPAEAMEVVRWSLKRTLPIPPEDLRIAYEVLNRTAGGAKVLVLSALERTLAAIERNLAAAGFEAILIEPIGLNIWNAVTVREPATSSDRLFLYVRENDFTTAVFRGSQPMFMRSRHLSGERTLQQEIRLSASYLRDTLQGNGFEQCYIAGNGIDDAAAGALATEFSAPVRTVRLRDYVEQAPSDLSGFEAELTACTGVFTG